MATAPFFLSPSRPGEGEGGAPRAAFGMPANGAFPDIQA